MRHLSASCLLLPVVGAFVVPLGPLASSKALVKPADTRSVAQTVGAHGFDRSITRVWAKKGKGKKESPPPMTVRHWDEEDEVEFIILEDTKAGTSINTTAQSLLKRGDAEYIISMPIDTPIVVVDETLKALEYGEDKTLDGMLPRIEAELAKMGAKMLKSAGVLTIEGEVEMYDEDEEEGEFADVEDDEDEDDKGDDVQIVNEVDADFADRRSPPKVEEEPFYEFDARDDSYMNDEEEDIEEMTEAVCEIDYEGKTYTVCKFIQPFYVVGKKSGDKWEVITGDQAEQVFDWVLSEDLEAEFDMLEQDFGDDR